MPSVGYGQGGLDNSVSHVASQLSALNLTADGQPAGAGGPTMYSMGGHPYPGTMYPTAYIPATMYQNLQMQDMGQHANGATPPQHYGDANGHEQGYQTGYMPTPSK